MSTKQTDAHQEAQQYYVDTFYNILMESIDEAELFLNQLVDENLLETQTYNKIKTLLNEEKNLPSA